MDQQKRAFVSDTGTTPDYSLILTSMKGTTAFTDSLFPD